MKSNNQLQNTYRKNRMLKLIEKNMMNRYIHRIHVVFNVPIANKKQRCTPFYIIAKLLNDI